MDAGRIARRAGPGPAGAPFAFDKSFSAEQLVTTRDGRAVTSKVYCDNGRIRSEISMQGMSMIMIVLPSENKAYSIMPSQKLVMAMPYDPARFKKFTLVSSTFDGTITKVGSETVDGVACDKYKVTTKEGKVYDLWVDPAVHKPVKMAAEDGAFVAEWKSYQPGPQPDSLFQVPSDYQVMEMPAMPGMGAGDSGGLPGM